MGNVLISLSDERERQLRRLAHDLYGGKKGSVSATVDAAVLKLSESDEREIAIQRVVALMNKGFDSGLKGAKAYEKRSDIYD